MVPVFFESFSFLLVCSYQINTTVFSCQKRSHTNLPKCVLAKVWRSLKDAQEYVDHILSQGDKKNRVSRVESAAKMWHDI